MVKWTEATPTYFIVYAQDADAEAAKIIAAKFTTEPYTLSDGCQRLQKTSDNLTGFINRMRSNYNRYPSNIWIIGAQVACPMFKEMVDNGRATAVTTSDKGYVYYQWWDGVVVIDGISYDVTAHMVTGYEKEESLATAKYIAAKGDPRANLRITMEEAAKVFEPRQIIGKVSDSLLQIVLVGARIDFMGTVVYSGLDGIYVMKDPPQYSGPITCSLEDYQVSTQNITSPLSGTLIVNFELTKIPRWYDPIIEGLKDVGRKFIEALGTAAFNVVAVIYNSLTDQTLTEEMATDFARKYGDWWPMANFTSVVLYGKSITGETQTEPNLSDWIDLVLLLAPLGLALIETFWGKLSLNIGNKGMASVTKSGLSKWDKIYEAAKAKGVSDEVLNAIHNKMIAANAAEVIKQTTPAWQKFISAAPKAIAGLIGTLAGIIGFTAFTEWTAKEAGVEILAFPVWVLITEKKWQEAKDHLPALYKSIDLATGVINVVAWLNPLTKDMWLQYAKDAKDQADSYAAVIEKHLPTVPIAEETITGTVTGVVDGDTIDVTDSNGYVWRVRLIGIDAPEFSTTKGKDSSKYLTDLVFGKIVVLHSDKSNQFDTYGRLLAVVLLNGVDINRKMLENGYAQYYFMGSSKWFSEEDYKSAYKGKGKVSITSSPTYCQIYVDQVDTGLLTSETLELLEGTYVIGCAKEGYKADSKTVTIVADKTIEIRFTLSKEEVEIPVTLVTPTKEKFKIYIVSTPANGKLYIDDVYTHHYTPSNESELKDCLSMLTPGSHKISVIKGGKKGEETVTIVSGDNGTITIELEDVGLAPVTPEVPTGLEARVASLEEDIKAIKIKLGI